jgi:hypothetical protein
VQPGHAVLEGFVELAEAADYKIDEVVDGGVGLLFGVDGVAFLVGVLLLNAEEVIDGVLEDLGHFLRDELFLRIAGRGTSPPSSAISYNKFKYTIVNKSHSDGYPQISISSK